jgi:protein tyrosine/serine phosphatase
MMRAIIPAILLNFALAVSAPAQLAAPPAEVKQSASAARPAERATPIDVSLNLYQIVPGLYRSAQPKQRDVALLNELGIRTIISFRANNPDEGRLDVPQINLVRVPMNTWDIGDDEIISALRAIEKARRDGPVLIHCQHGADRTGVVSAMYRIIEQGWTAEQAVRELRQGGYGFHSIWAHLPRYVQRADVTALRARLAVGQEK